MMMSGIDTRKKKNNRKHAGNLKVAASLTLLSILIASAFIGYLPQLDSRFHLLLPSSSAAASVVQENTGSCSSPPLPSSCSATITLSTDVTSGDVLVVAVFDNNLAPVSSLSVTDTLSSTFTSQISQNLITGRIAIFTATPGSSGADTVTVADSTTNGIWADVFEVSGVTTAGAQTASGFNICSSSGDCPFSTSSSIAFIPGAFLVSIVQCSDCDLNGFTPGTGFTSDTLIASNTYDQYSVSGVSSPTSFPATGNIADLGGGILDDVGLALEPQSTTTTTTTSTTTSTTTTIATTTSISTTTSTTTSTSTSTTTSTILVYPTTTHVYCKPSRVDAGKSVSCEAIVSSRNGDGTPTGTVTYGYNDDGTLAYQNTESCQVVASSSSCYATFTLEFPLFGYALVTASYSGDLTHQSSHGATLEKVLR